MKFISVSILFICLLAATFSQWWLIAAYEINQSYIAKELCVNKARPVNHCNGHCFLNRQMDKEEKPASPFSANNSEKFEIQLFCVEASASELTSITSQRTFLSCPQHFTLQQVVRNLLQPPRA